MPPLPGGLPFDQRIDFADRGIFFDCSDVKRALYECVHVQLTATARPVAEKFENAFEPAHELIEKAVVVGMYFVDEFVQIIFVPGAEINESLHRLVGICRDVLTLSALYDSNSVVCEESEVGDAVVDVGGLVDSNEWFVEDGKEVAE